MALCALASLCDRGQRLGAVDEDLEPVPFPRRRLAGSPPARRRIQGAELAVLPQPPAVVRDDQALQPVAESFVEPLEN